MSNYIETAEYWIGHHASGGKALECGFQDEQERCAWAAGVRAENERQEKGKKWNRSKTLWTGIGLLVLGLILIFCGEAGIGSGLTVGGVLSAGMRLVTSKPIELR